MRLYGKGSGLGTNSMKKLSLVFATLLITAGLAVVLYVYMTTPREEGIAHLKAVKLKPNSQLASFSSPFVSRDTTRPVEIIDIPSHITKAPYVYYYSLPVGDKNIHVIIRNPSPKDTSAWIDMDMDNCLSDEKEFVGKRKIYGRANSSKIEYYYDFGIIELPEEKSCSRFHLYCGIGGHYVYIQPTHFYTGKIRLQDRIYHVAVIDGDYDGKFNTLYSPGGDYRYPKCDVFVIDEPRGISTFGHKFDRSKISPLGHYAKIGDQYFSVSISDNDKLVRMQATEPTYGTLKVGNNRRLATRVFSDAASQSINFNDEIKLPSGSYQMHWGQLSYTDSNGKCHNFRPNFENDIRKGQFEIKAGETFIIQPGPPFTIKTDIRKQSNNQLSINAGLVGNEGEGYGLTFSQKNKEPTIRIVDENNTTLHVGTMEYG